VLAWNFDIDNNETEDARDRSFRKLSPMLEFSASLAKAFLIDQLQTSRSDVANLQLPTNPQHSLCHISSMAG
jgi:hypothetical protein